MKDFLNVEDAFKVEFVHWWSVWSRIFNYRIKHHSNRGIMNSISKSIEQTLPSLIFNPTQLKSDQETVQIDPFYYISYFYFRIHQFIPCSMIGHDIQEFRAFSRILEGSEYHLEFRMSEILFENRSNRSKDLF